MEIPNPLVETSYPIAFDGISAHHVEPAIHQLIERSRLRLREIASSTAPRTYANTMQALDTMTEPLDIALGLARHLEAVCSSKEMRAALNAVEGPASAFYSSIPLDPELWNAVKTYAATADAQTLSGARKRYLEKTIDGFRRHGAELDPEGKRRLEEIDVELTKLTTKFSENVLDATNAFDLVLTTEDALAGLPESAREAARDNAKSKGVEGWRFTLQAPSYIAVMTYLDDALVRRDVWRAYNTRAAAGVHDNVPLILRVLELRSEKAALLGYRDFADFVLEERMAKSGARAEEFVEDLRRRTEASFHSEQASLLAFRRSLEGPGAGPLEPWDVGYYAEKQRKALYDFDEEELRPYFPMERVVEGLFELVHRVFGVRVAARPGVAGWHPTALFYEVTDARGQLLGGFYADWFPRETKRGGAWMDAFLTGGPRDGGFDPHLGAICGNLTPPVSGKPSLLTHNEVETIFHEFGHLLHLLLSRVEVRSLAGTNVPWDFVELPSQIMENWCWERESLNLFARHYQTGAPLPEDLFEKMRRARTYRAASGQMRQLSFAALDLALHRRYDPASDGPLLPFSRSVMQPYQPTVLPDDYAMIASFTHLFSSPVAYAAGYYSYKWSEVLDADAFTRFLQEGIFSETVGHEFRDKILARGDSDDPARLYRDFMGRDPDLNALLVRSGLAG
ncbi:MAG: M3 family metallopeptidase [Bryobacteraceae bacterium]|nr:M3 family metallopeptidase [Bryobacteraceae bacterium]